MTTKIPQPTRTILIVVLLVFVVSYPFFWWKNYEVRRLKAARQFIKTYYGQKPPKADPWGTPYQVTKTEIPNGIVVIVSSAGPDRKFGTQDDLNGGYKRSLIAETY